MASSISTDIPGVANCFEADTVRAFEAALGKPVQRRSGRRVHYSGRDCEDGRVYEQSLTRARISRDDHVH